MNFPIIQESYNFECTKCGNCCRGDQKVNLNPYDLYKIARFKNFKHTRDLFKSNIVHLVKAQNDAWLPQIKFKSISNKKVKFCPFLINELDEENRLLGLCSLHPNLKPLICSMAPVGRVLDFRENTEHYIFVKPDPLCPGVDKDKSNDLNEIKLQMEFELNHEKEFLRRLDQIQDHNYSKDYYMENFYLFSIVEPFV